MNNSDAESQPTPSSQQARTRMPAEWEPHQGTWFSWPHNRDTWPVGLGKAEKSLAGAVRALASGETVHINVLNGDHRRHVHDLVGSSDGVVYHMIPTNDAWCRDHGATFVHAPDGTLRAVDWHYNAWGGKYPPYDLDQQVARRMADVVSAERIESDWTLEGGALEPNGAGTLMTTASCVLNPNRNPGKTRQDAEQEFARCLGIRHTIWLDGELEGDDTDGHIDNLARFTAADRVLVPEAPGDARHEQAFRRLRDMLDGARTADEKSIRVRTLPHPDPVYFEKTRLPASYANFYIGNAVVIVPTYHCDADDEAIRILADEFPDRTVVGFDCTEVIRGLGAFHCLTQQVFTNQPR